MQAVQTELVEFVKLNLLSAKHNQKYPKFILESQEYMHPDKTEDEKHGSQQHSKVYQKPR